MLARFIIVFLLAFCVNAFSQTLPKIKLTDTLYLYSGIEKAKQSETIKRLYEQQTNQLKNGGLVFNALNVKSKAKDFTVKNLKGKTFNLFTEIQNGPVIILWYQGGWNPYCTIALRYFNLYYPEFKKYGAKIIALSPEIPEKTVITKSKNKLTFDVFQDENNAIAKQYGIVYTLNDTLRQELETKYQLSKFIGQKKSELPLPAAYVIRPDGKITFAFIDADYSKRAEPHDFLRVLKGMGFLPRQ